VLPDPDSPDACLVLVKAVPGASREQIAGVLGDRLKVRVAAPPEGGRANAALCALVVRALGVPGARAQVVAGGASPVKTLRIGGVAPEAARRALGLGAGPPAARGRDRLGG
jgi:hypothetical protein